MTYQVLSSTTSDNLTIQSVVSSPDVTVPNGPDGATANLKTYLEGPTAYTDFGTAFWDGRTVKFPVYGGGCTRREYACVIVAPTNMGYSDPAYSGIRSEEQTCPPPNAPIEDAILRYEIIDSGSGFTNNDFLEMTTFDNGTAFGAQFEIGTVAAGGVLTSLTMSDGGQFYEVGQLMRVRDVNGNDKDAVVRVLTVNSGAVVTYEIVDGGSGFQSSPDSLLVSDNNLEGQQAGFGALFTITELGANNSVKFTSMLSAGAGYKYNDVLRLMGSDHGNTDDVLIRVLSVEDQDPI